MQRSDIVKKFVRKTLKHDKFKTWFYPYVQSGIETRSLKLPYVPVPTRTESYKKSPIPVMTQIANYLN